MKSQLETMFERMGARVKIRETVNERRPAGIDIRSDREGEYFDIGVEPSDSVEYEVVDIRPGMRHVLLMARRDDGKQKFLCGHDERHWFVCRRSRRIGCRVLFPRWKRCKPSEVRVAVGSRVKPH